MTKKLIITNWKDYVQSPKQAEELFRLVQNYSGTINPTPYTLITCPSLQYLPATGYQPPANLGAQNISLDNSSGLSPKNLKKLKVKYVIIGHSSKRAQGETDNIINKKIKLAIKEKLKIILCVGEPLDIRRQGLKAVKKFIAGQLKKDLKKILNLKSKILNLIIAYEPIWAITSQTATETADDPQKSIEIIKFIKEYLQTTNYKLPAFALTSYGRAKQPKIIYGGSINSKNISAFLSYPEIEGVLIGHASTQKTEFLKILKNI